MTTSPIAAALMLAECEALARTPMPVIRVNDHMRSRGKLVSFRNMPADVSRTSDIGRRVRCAAQESAGCSNCPNEAFKEHHPLPPLDQTNALTYLSRAGSVRIDDEVLRSDCPRRKGCTSDR